MRTKALKPLRQMAVAGALFSLNHINVKQERAKKAGMGIKNLFMLNTCFFKGRRWCIK